MARTAIPLKRKNQDTRAEAIDYLEASIDKEIDKRDNENFEEFDMEIGSFVKKYGFKTEDIRDILKTLNKRYTDWKISARFGGYKTILYISKK